MPHIHTFYAFISIRYENQHQTLNIKKIDRGRIKFREYSITQLQPKRFRTVAFNIKKIDRDRIKFREYSIKQLQPKRFRTVTFTDILSQICLIIFLLSSWICVQCRNKHRVRCVKISCQKISAKRKSPEDWPLIFWPKVRHVYPSFHLPLEYELRSLYTEIIHSYHTRNNELSLLDIMNLTLKRMTWNYMCVLRSCCSAKPNMFY